VQALYFLVVGKNPPKPPENRAARLCIHITVSAQKIKTSQLKKERSVTHMPNLTRNKAITLRMTPEEFEFFQNQMKTAKQKTQTDFFLSVLRKKPIIVIEDLRPALQELKRQGNNLNQIARKLNETSSFGESATRVMNECWKAYRAMASLEGVIKDAIVQRKGGQGKTQESD
jgi:hypothetical protein